MKQLTLIFLIIALTSSSCNHSKDESRQFRNQLEQRFLEDTTVTLRINGHPRAFRAKKENMARLMDFQKFLDDFSNKPLLLDESESIDVTGDGRLEKVSTRILFHGDTCVVSARIMSQDGLIYSDDLQIDQDFNAEVMWCNDSLYYQLKSHCDFYLALLNRSILDDFIPTRDMDKRRLDFFLSHQRGLLADRGLDSTHIELEVQHWKNYVSEFKGKLVYKMDENDRTVYLWDESKKAFIWFYAP
ncbi:MAG: hypothetical protein HZB59_02830 [Ignavibacteriales bacterium]|nr:hypothetical protein [Ignavibacteriales bacterium]